jgi:ribulose-5-phosphate 4-epimerase/fuculose-1-phosphate aldolase
MSDIKDIITLGKSLAQFVVGTEGNISKKSKNFFLIKASGTNLKNLTPKDVIKCTLLGEQINNFNKKPSMETAFHTWLLKFPNINFVAHTHPIDTLSILCTNNIYEFANHRLFPDQVVFNGKKSCVIPYSMPGEELLNHIVQAVTDFINIEKYFPKLILLQNHGIICCGSSYKECLIATEICEKAASIFLKSKNLDSINYLNNEEILKILKDKNEIYRKKIIS